MRGEKNTLYYKLYSDIKDKIVKNELKKNTKLESVRTCAKRLNISTTTVEKAYNQLGIEGYVESIPRSGFIINDVTEVKTSSQEKPKPILHNQYYNAGLTEDLFDIKAYKSISNKVYNYFQEELYTQCHPLGEPLLREEIRKHILRERNVQCDINQIVIGPGIQSLLNIILSISEGKTVSFLTPEFSKAMTIFRGYNYQLYPFESISEILKCKTDFLYLSPSNTYPTGDVLGINDRTNLMKWAHKNNSYIIEDDYNYFIRYNSYSIPSMYSIDDHNHVIYMGSFSKTLLPSIRISYMVLPNPLYQTYKKSYHAFSQGVSKITQLTVGLYMKEGFYKRHTKKLYHKYALKNAIIIKELDAVNHDDFVIRSTDSNLHVVIDFRNESSFNNCIHQLQKHKYQYETIHNSYSIIFPYSGISNDKMSEVVKTLFQNKTHI